MSANALGVDLGGTSAKIGIVDDSGRILSQTTVLTQGTPGEMAHSIGEAYRRFNRKTRRCGAGVPGPLTTDRRTIVQAVNLGWKNVPFERLLSRELEQPVALENDANVACFGEFRAGAGQGASDVALFTLGTGVGGGLVLGGRLVTGHVGCAAEFGHIPIAMRGRRCGCGRRGCLEAYASSKAMTHARGGGLSAKQIFEHARRGDPRSVKIVNEMCEALGAGISAVVHAVDPQVVILSGGMSLAGAYLLKRVRVEARRRMFSQCVASTKIVLGKLGDRAGMIGAALWALERHGNG